MSRLREDDLIEEKMDYTPLVGRARHALVVDERDHWKRMFNRLDAAITRHMRDCEANDVPDTHDEALWAARDRVLRDSAKGAA